MQVMVIKYEDTSEGLSLARCAKLMPRNLLCLGCSGSANFWVFPNIDTYYSYHDYVGDSYYYS